MLTTEQTNRYHQLKEKCKSAWIDFATAILEIRERKLYLVEHSTFEDFCANELSYSGRHIRQMIASANVVKNLERNHGSFPPTTERQARPLAKLEPELQAEAWAEIIEENKYPNISSQIVAEKVETKKELNEVVKEVKRNNQPDTIFVQTPLTEREILKRAKELKEERKQAYKIKLQERIEIKAKQPLSSEEQTMLNKAKNGETVVININKHFAVLKWAKDNNKYQQIDRYSDWGNPFYLDKDGNRDEVCDAYEYHYLPHKASLIKKIHLLKGKVLGCHCAPLRCHGHGISNTINRIENE